MWILPDNYHLVIDSNLVRWLCDTPDIRESGIRRCMFQIDIIKKEPDWCRDWSRLKLNEAYLPSI